MAITILMLSQLLLLLLLLMLAQVVIDYWCNNLLSDYPLENVVLYHVIEYIDIKIYR